MDSSQQEKQERATPRIYRRNEHLVSRKNVDPDALKIIHRLNRNGYKAYLVGGGVRDLLLGKRPKDFDVATNARPLRVKALFRNCRIIGRRFKLAHIYFAGGKIIEVSTFRDVAALPEAEESDAKGQLLIKHDNVYGNEITDALRRDITINALFYDLATFSIVDYVGGMQDLRDGVVRMIGDPDIRFAEDPVRMMRVVRYAAKAEFAIEEECRASILRNHALIESSSPMRLFEELKKDFCSGFSARTLPKLCQHELLQHLIPELARRDLLLAVDGPCVAAMLHADGVVAAQSSTNATPMLCLLALFMLHSDLDSLDLSAHFSDVDGVREFVAGAFSKLAVPKRERDKISGILALWLKVLNTPAERLKSAVVVKNENFADLLILLEMLNRKGGQRELIAFLEGLRGRREPGGGDRRRGRHRGGGRRRESQARHPMLRRMG